MSIPCPAVTSIDITIAEKSLNRSWLMITGGLEAILDRGSLGTPGSGPRGCTTPQNLCDCHGTPLSKAVAHGDFPG